MEMLVESAAAGDSVPPLAEIMMRDQYSPSSNPCGGRASRRTVCRCSGPRVMRRGKASIHPAAEGMPRLDGVGRQNRKVTERVGHRITKEEADRDLDRLCAGVIQRQRPAAGAMVEVDGMRCDQDALCCGGAGEPRDDGENGEQSAHRQKKVQVSVMVPV